MLSVAVGGVCHDLHIGLCGPPCKTAGGSGATQRPHVLPVSKRQNRHPGNRNKHFGDRTMFHRQRDRHHRQPDHAHHADVAAAMPAPTAPQCHSCQRHCQHQTNKMNPMIEPVTRHRKYGQQHEPGHAVQQAQPRQADGDSIEEAAGRRHASGVTLLHPWRQPLSAWRHGPRTRVAMQTAGR